MTNKELKALIKIFESSELGRLKLERDDVTIELEKPKVQDREQQVRYVEHNQVQNHPQKPVEEEHNKVSNYMSIKAPLVGTFYEAAAPDQPPFVREGQTVKKGDTLFIIEAMKVMNEITAPESGTLKHIHVENGNMVMFDQVVMEIE